MYRKLLIVLMFVCGAASISKAELLAHWPFDTDANDVVGTYNLTLVGQTYIDHTDPHFGSGAMHLRNSASWTKLQVRDYASVNNANGLWSNVTGDFTVCMWVKQDNDSTLVDNYAKTFFAGQALPGLNNTPDSTYACFPYPTAGGTIESLGFEATIPWSSQYRIWTSKGTDPWKGTWDHWAFVRSGYILYVYKNGVQYAQGSTLTNTFNGSNIQAFYIGGGWGGGMMGQIDDMGIWNESLSVSSINSVMQNGVPLVTNARILNPAIGAVNIAPVVTLSWQAGPLAVSHDVYLGTNQPSVLTATVNVPLGVYLGNQSASSKLVTLIPNTTYYWRVDERNNDSSVSLGSVWKFTTKSYTIDDFESYSNNSAMQAKWAATNAAISLEKTIANNYSGQSMRINYNTAISPYYSKVVYDLGTAQDWTANAMKILAIYFHGSTNNVSEQIYATLEDSVAHASTVIYGYPGDLVQSDLTPRWNEWDINLQNFSASGVNLASVKKVTIGIGDGIAGGSSGTVYIDDVRLYQKKCIGEYAPAGDLNGDCRVDINDVFILAQDWLLKGDGDITVASPNNAGLVAYYTFNETSGSTANDSSGHNNNATVNPGNAWNTQGKFAGCLNFTGDYNTGAVVVVPDSVFNSITNQITISVWVNADANSYQQMTIFDSNGTNTTLWPEPKWEGTVGFTADGEGVYWPKAQPQDYKGLWHHYAMVKNTSKGIQRLYCDGELVAENRDAEVIPAAIKNFIVGRSYTTDTRYGTDAFVGKLDDLRIYNYALSQAEVLNLAQVSSFHQRVVSDADAYEDSNNEIIDFKDFATIAKKWLQLQLWP